MIVETVTATQDVSALRLHSPLRGPDQRLWRRTSRFEDARYGLCASYAMRRTPISSTTIAPCASRSISRRKASRNFPNALEDQGTHVLERRYSGDEGQTRV